MWLMRGKRAERSGLTVLTQASFSGYPGAEGQFSQLPSLSLISSHRPASSRQLLRPLLRQDGTKTLWRPFPRRLGTTTCSFSPASPGTNSGRKGCCTDRATQQPSRPQAPHVGLKHLLVQASPQSKGLPFQPPLTSGNESGGRGDR